MFLHCFQTCGLMFGKRPFYSGAYSAIWGIGRGENDRAFLPFYGVIPTHYPPLRSLLAYRILRRQAPDKIELHRVLLRQLSPSMESAWADGRMHNSLGYTPFSREMLGKNKGMRDVERQRGAWWPESPMISAKDGEEIWRWHQPMRRSSMPTTGCGSSSSP